MNRSSRQLLSGFIVLILSSFVLTAIPTVSDSHATTVTPAVNIAPSAGPGAVNLGKAANFAVLAKSGITATGVTHITGNVGISPAAASDIEGFGLIADISNQFATSSLVTGKVYAANYADPTPTTMTTAISDMETAYTDAAGRSDYTATELYGGDLSGRTLTAGLYKWSSGVIITTDFTISGSAFDVWIFQIAQTLDISTNQHVLLVGGALPQNIFWQVFGTVTLQAGSVFNGNILSQTSIALVTGATLNGRALAQTAVTIDAGTIQGPPGSSSNPLPFPVWAIILIIAGIAAFALITIFVLLKKRKSKK